MKRTVGFLAGFSTVALLLVAVVLYGSRLVPASDHQDSPVTVARPGADITDVFLLPAQNPKNVVLAMDVHPLIPRGMSAPVRFDPAVMYQFKIDTTGDYREDRVIQFRAVGSGARQHLVMYGPAAPAMVGTRSSWVGHSASFSFGRVSTMPGGIKVFAGARREPFYLDLAQFFKIIPDRNYKNHPHVPSPTASCFRKPGIDFFRDYNVLSFVVEMPRAMLAGPKGMPAIIHMYATTSVRESGANYTQIERLGRPGVKELFEAFGDHDTSNRSTPWSDPLLARSIVSFMTAPKPLGAGRSFKLATAVERTLMPDELTANIGAGGTAGYLAVETKGKSALPTAVVRVVPNAGLQGLKKSIANKTSEFGGRDFSSPVIDLSLGVVFGTLGQKVGLAPDDGKATGCLTSDNVTAGPREVMSAFPYLGSPI